MSILPCLLTLLTPLFPGGDPQPGEILLGQQPYRFRWDPAFGRTQDGADLGSTHGCVQVDAQGRIYVNSDTERAVMVFAKDGKLLRSFGAEFANGLHGMTLVREGEQEFLYLAHIGRHEVAKLTLEGEVLWRLGWPEESGKYEQEGEYRPTSVAVLPDGGLFVADGYGKSWVHQYDSKRKYLRSIGGPGNAPGQFQTPHGMAIDRRGGKSRLLVCDRENHRLEYFDLDGNYLGLVEGMLRRPCNVSFHGDTLAVADLAGRVTLLDEQNQLICHLGDNPDPALRASNQILRDLWKDGEFTAPHGLAFGPEGDLYVEEWNLLGRLVRLERFGK